MDDIELVKDKKVKVREIWPLLKKYLSDQKWGVFILAVLVFSTVGLELYSPHIIRNFIDEISAGANTDKLIRLSVLYIGLAVILQLFSIFTTYLSQNIGWRATNRLRNDLTEHCMNLDMSFHKDHLPGELIQRIDGDVASLSNLFSNFAIRITADFFLLFGILAVMFNEDWRLGAGLSVFAVVATIILFKVSSVGVNNWEKQSKTYSEFYGFLGEHLTNREDIQTLGVYDFVKSKFKNLLNGMFKITLKAILVSNAMFVSTIVLFTIALILSLGLGSYLWLTGVITMGTVYLIYNYTEMIRGPVQQLQGQLEDLQKALGGLKRIKDLLEIKPVVIFNPSGPNIESIESLAFQNVNFSYETDMPVIKDLSFELLKGEKLGLIGRTGSGKTTISRLLLRLYDVNSGNVLINGIELNKMTLNNLKNLIGVVTQDVELFKATIRDNLTFFNNEVNDAIILDAFEKLGLTDWLNRFPKGLDTVLLDGSTGLSAGQAQLLAFVRIFLKDPALIILDEATSRLDPATETLISKVVDNLLKDRMAIVIAHRLWTVQKCDRILILENGQKTEFGLRTSLIDDNTSRFASLLKVGMEEVLV